MKKLYVELADNHIKRECGLMNRKSMPKNSGMLFRFPYSTRLSFWMKNTYIPLDIAYIDDNGKVMQIETMIPLSTRAIVSKNECRYALEVNKGWFKENSINVGSKIGGLGFDFTRKAQMTPQTPLPQDPNAPQDTNVQQQTQPNPDVVLNKSIKETIEDADKKNLKLTIIYRKEDGFILPPKTISPPYDMKNLRREEDNKRHEEFTCWDEQEGQYKTFFISGIMNIEPVEKPLEKPVEKI